MAFENKFITVEQYLRKISGQEKEVLLVDHNYVKPWNSHPDSHRTKPARLLFMKGLQRYSSLSDNRNLLCTEEVDVVRCGRESVLSPFDNLKIKPLSIECQQFFAAEKNDPPDLSTCMPKQKRLYQDVVKVLNADRLARLTYSGTPLECVKLRLVSENSACLLREIFGGIFWDSDLLSWLHKSILNSCCFEIVASYINVLQALRTIVPTLVDKLLSSHSGSCMSDTVMQIVKKQYDPILPLLNQYKTKKLPGNPIILVSPSGPSKQMANSPRFRFWHNHLSSLCKVMNVPVYSIDEKCPTTVEDCLDQIITSLRNKVVELRNHYPNRPIILLGWTVGALIACHVALQEHVAAVICLGFPLTGVNGSRGDLKDPLLDSKVPTLFVIGQNASMCSSDDVEDFRARMKAETALVIVGGADDFLRLSAIKMHMEHVTQSMIDRCILDEISDFLLSIFIKLPASSVSNMLPLVRNCTPIKESSSELREDEGKRKRRKPREYSPELSPVRKRSRHHIPRQRKTRGEKKERRRARLPIPCNAMPSRDSLIGDAFGNNKMPRSSSSKQHFPISTNPVIPKARLSPSSSETSSSGSCVVEKPSIPKPVKKTTDKRVGRPAAGTWRKRLSGKAIIGLNENNVKKVSKPDAEKCDPVIPVKSTLNSEPKSSIPFPVNILPKKNDPVDVEKAFGRDSSFLPRPLTPPEPEDTVSAEETEKVMAELEAMSDIPISQSSPVSSSVATTTGLLSQVIAASERSFLPISEEPIDNISAASNAVSIVKPTVSTADDLKSSLPLSVSPGFRTVFQQSKVLPSGSIQNLKPVGISLIGNTQASSISPNKSTVITVPSPGTTAILFSSAAAIRAQSGKMIQLLSKGTLPVNAKNSTASISVNSTNSSESTDQQACNLSLLSDVAGMTEPLKETARKVEASQSATLVKLAVPEKTQAQPIKCLKVIKSVRAPSPPIRIETPEELVEKQLAIQALNNSIGIETPSAPVKESGYSICYTKADGSIVSHAVTRPGYHPYLSRSSLIATPIRGRGRARPAFSSKPFRVYDM